MKSESIIEGLNRHIETKRASMGIQSKGHLVLHTEIYANTAFKAYKTFKYTLWFYHSGKSYKVVTVQQVEKVLEGKENQIIEKLDSELSSLLFSWIGSDSYNKVIEGEYYGVSENPNE